MTSKLSLGDVPEALSIVANSFCFGFINIPDWNVGGESASGTSLASELWLCVEPRRFKHKFYSLSRKSIVINILSSPAPLWGCVCPCSPSMLRFWETPSHGNTPWHSENKIQNYFSLENFTPDQLFAEMKQRSFLKIYQSSTCHICHFVKYSPSPLAPDLRGHCTRQSLGSRTWRASPRCWPGSGWPSPAPPLSWRWRPPVLKTTKSQSNAQSFMNLLSAPSSWVTLWGNPSRSSPRGWQAAPCYTGRCSLSCLLAARRWGSSMKPGCYCHEL